MAPRYHGVPLGSFDQEKTAILEQVGIKSGPVEVLASGTVISFSGNPIEISLENLKLIFEFKDDEGNKEIRVQPEAVQNTLRVTLYNFSSPLGTGSGKPIPVGGFRGRRLYIHYRVYTMQGGADRTLDFTLYLGEEAKKDG